MINSAKGAIRLKTLLVSDDVKYNLNFMLGLGLGMITVSLQFGDVYLLHSINKPH